MTGSKWLWTLIVMVGVGRLHAATGVAQIQGTTEGSPVSGSVTFEDTAKGLKMDVQVSGVIPGEKGFHIHEFGGCGDTGKKAGGHYNPGDRPHGHVMKDGPKKAHAGDLGNIVIGADGAGTLSAVIPQLTLTGGKYAVGGRAVILHEKADDFGQPLGNAGGRIGCGLIVITGN